MVPPVVCGATAQPPVPAEGIKALPAVLSTAPLKVCAMPTVKDSNTPSRERHHWVVLFLFMSNQYYWIKKCTEKRSDQLVRRSTASLNKPTNTFFGRILLSASN